MSLSSKKISSLGVVLKIIVPAVFLSVVQETEKEEGPIFSILTFFGIEETPARPIYFWAWPVNKIAITKLKTRIVNWRIEEKDKGRLLKLFIILI